MAGNSRSGRRPSVETLLGDAEMSTRLSIEACTAALEMAHDVHHRVITARAAHRRARTIRLAPDPTPLDLREAA